MNKEKAADLFEEGALIYIEEGEPGYTRIRHGKGFSYKDEKGRTIKNKHALERLKALVIPPAWKDVWICPYPEGHILATGRDSDGRKQYIYHPDWQSHSRLQNFGNLLTFGQCLPAMRDQLSTDLKEKRLIREKVLALVVSLLDKTLIRIGNAYYSQHNESYGLTTLQDEHVKITGKRLKFTFTGKSSIDHEIDLEEKQLAELVKACRDLPGQDLFQYEDDNGTVRSISSGDVNQYLKDLTGGEFTAKSFRTWGGSVYMVETLYAMPPAEDEKATKRNITEAVKRVAERLGNTAAVARQHYIHPVVIEAYENGTLHKTVNAQRESKSAQGLDRYEKALLKLMEKSTGEK